VQLALAECHPKALNAAPMSILGKIFTWWNGATFGTMLDSARHGERVGEDAQGNQYYRAKKPFPKGHPFAGRERRWVIYNGANDASRVPAEWHGWLHGSFDNGAVPESNLPPPRIWEVDYTPNATGTSAAYRPQGALERGGKRAAATGDYEAWSPE
jgi:NADH:ubiquinone oxidoreductase subunit